MHFTCSRANNTYSAGTEKLTEVQLYMSTSCQPGSRVIRAFSDVEKLFFPLFSDLAVKAAKSTIKKGFSMSEKPRINSRVDKCYRQGCRGNSPIGKKYQKEHSLVYNKFRQIARSRDYYITDSM